MQELDKDTLEYHPLKRSRLKIINNLCQYSPFFLFPILAMDSEHPWWLVLIAIAVVLCVGALYMAIFRRWFMPKPDMFCTTELTKVQKFFYYAMMIVVPVLTIMVYKVPPLGPIIDIILAIAFNFGATMWLCYRVTRR